MREVVMLGPNPRKPKKQSSTSRSYYDTGMLRHHPIFKEEGAKILKYCAKTSAVAKLIAGANYRPTSRDILEDTSDSAPTDPMYVLKQFEDAYTEASRVSKTVQEQQAINDAISDIRTKLIALAGLTEQQRIAGRALLREVGSANYAAAIQASGDPLTAFKQKYPDGTPIPGKKSYQTFERFGPGFWSPDKTDFMFKTGAKPDEGTLTFPANIGDIPVSCYPDFCRDFAGKCVTYFGEGPIKLDFLAEKDYKEGSELSGWLSRKIDHADYKKFVDTMATALYQKGVSLEQGQFDILDDDVKLKLKEIETNRKAQIAQGVIHAATIPQPPGGAPQNQNIAQPLVPLNGGNAPLNNQNNNNTNSRLVITPQNNDTDDDDDTLSNDSGNDTDDDSNDNSFSM